MCVGGGIVSLKWVHVRRRERMSGVLRWEVIEFWISRGMVRSAGGGGEEIDIVFVD